MHSIKYALFLLLFPGFLLAQTDLNWYLPEAGPYAQHIPTPSSRIGHEVGAWHISHDKLVAYMHDLADASDRIQLLEYGRSHENRPLVCLIITSPQNHKQLDRIKKRRSALCDPNRSADIDPEREPSVVYMGYSIHGNEASGSNASMLVAYHLAASKDQAVLDMLDQTVVLLDPSFNPDGLHRFSTWVNSHRSRNGSLDPAGDEFNETWPSGRTNHYWFDLNRDWLVAQQPESEGRVAIFQEWHPNVLTDHHEMGSNSTFFFQPGVPSRVNPVTPARNQELTAAIGKYHAEALTAKGIAFFSKESYDDFYYGKGSTYPDGNGCIGILFEQASSRGSARNTPNGVLDFPFTIRNQVITSMSTLRAVSELKGELNAYLRDFYTSAADEALKDPVRAYVFSAQGHGPELLRVLQLHKVAVYSLGKELEVNENTFEPGAAFIVPTGQAQYRMVRTVFERPTAFSDSIFYDISAWTLPDAFGLDWAPLSGNVFSAKMLGEKVEAPVDEPKWTFEKAGYAYAVEAQDPQLASFLHHALSAGLLVKVCTEPVENSGHKLGAGSAVVMVGQEQNVHAVVEEISEKLNIQVIALSNGQSTEGPDLGSRTLKPLELPKVLLITGSGMSAYDVGEVWHLFDVRVGMPVTLVDANRVNNRLLEGYNVVILANGRPSGLSADVLRPFVASGNTLIATGGATGYLAGGLVNAAGIAGGQQAKGRRPYASQEEDSRALRMPGSIFRAEADLTHPLCFGYGKTEIPVFMRGNYFLEPSDNPYASPLVLSDNPLMAGYIHPDVEREVGGSAAAVVYGLGAGRVICMPVNPCFRGFWLGTNRLLTNAVFFGQIIDQATVER